MSGDFSVELSSPFFAYDGELQEPIRTGMISGNIFDILHKIQGCSTDTRTLGSTIVPSVRLSGISVIGKCIIGSYALTPDTTAIIYIRIFLSST